MKTAFKPKNFRKKEDIDDSRDDFLQPKIKAVSAPKAVLSFEDGDDDNDLEFKVKKSKASKNLKKRLNQPPDIHSISSQPTVSYIDNTTGAYSSEALASLRGQQAYFVPSSEFKNDGEAMELAGDEAESMDALTDQVSNKTKKSVSFMSEESEMAINKMIRKLEADTKAQQGDEDGGRVNMSVKKALPEFVPLDVDNEEGDVSWERELLRRSGARPLAFPGNPLAPAAPLASLDQTSVPPSQSPAQTGTSPAISDVLTSLRRATSTLSESCEASSRRLQALQTELQLLTTDSQLTKTILDSEKQKVELLRVIVTLLSE